MQTSLVKGKASSINGTPVTVLTNDSNAVYSTVTIELFNDGVVGTDPDATGYIYIADNDSPANLDKIDYVVMQAGGFYQRTCSLIGPGEKIIINFSNSTIRARITGLKAS